MTDTRNDSRQDLHPSDGARFLFEHVAASGPTGPTEATEATEATETTETTEGDARYRAAIFTPDQRFDYDAVLSADGSVEIIATGTAAPAELERKLSTIAKVMARNASKNRQAGLPPWPHRVLRWRGPK